MPSTEERAAVSRFVSAGGRLLGDGRKRRIVRAAIRRSADSGLGLDAQTFLGRCCPRRSAATRPKSPWSRRTAGRPLAPAQLAIYGTAWQARSGVVSLRQRPGDLVGDFLADVQRLHSRKRKSRAVPELGGPAQRSRILWDEYFHGMRRSLSSYFAATPLPWAGLQIAFAFARLFSPSRGVRDPSDAAGTESRLSPLEFVDTLGDLYQSAHAAPAAVEIAYQRLRLSLARKLGIPANTRLPELCQAAADRSRMACRRAVQYSFATPSAPCATSIWTTTKHWTWSASFTDIRIVWKLSGSPQKRESAWK